MAVVSPEFRTHIHRARQGSSLALLLATLSCADSAGPSGLDEPAAQTIIAFADNSTGWYAIFTASPDRVSLKRLSPYTSLGDLDPAWSANGKRIAYSTLVPYGKHEIAVMNSDGSNMVQVTKGSSGANYTPAWSPDGKRIVFVGNGDRNSRIFAINVDGSGLSQLTNGIAADTSPDWSPDGTRIIFARDLNGLENKGIFSMNPDGSNVQQLTSGYVDREPTWSADGKRIAFVREIENEGRNLFVMNATDGSDLKQLTHGIPQVADPAWSPDGTSLAFGVLSQSKVCLDDEDGNKYYPCGRDVRRISLDGVVDPAWVLVNASNPAWRR